jgi:hypothetical protein
MDAADCEKEPPRNKPSRDAAPFDKRLIAALVTDDPQANNNASL